MWMTRPAASGPVEKAYSSPNPAHSGFGLDLRLRGSIPVIHTLYDYDKGIS